MYIYIYILIYKWSCSPLPFGGAAGPNDNVLDVSSMSIYIGRKDKWTSHYLQFPKETAGSKHPMYKGDTLW
jgi:hypothetical protein